MKTYHLYLKDREDPILLQFDREPSIPKPDPNDNGIITLYTAHGRTLISESDFIALIPNPPDT